MPEHPGEEVIRSGEDGCFQLTKAPNVAPILDEVCDYELEVAGQPACLITPSPSERTERQYLSFLIVQYPRALSPCTFL